MQTLYKSSLNLSLSQVNLNLALSKALDASKAEIGMFKLGVHMLDDLVAAKQAKTKAAQDEGASLKKQLDSEMDKLEKETERAENLVERVEFAKMRWAQIFSECYNKKPRLWKREDFHIPTVYQQMAAATTKLKSGAT